MDREITQPMISLAKVVASRANAMRLNLPDHEKVIKEFVGILQHVEHCAAWLKHYHGDQPCDGNEYELADIGKRCAANAQDAREVLRDGYGILHRHVQRLNRGPGELRAAGSTAILRVAVATEADAGGCAATLRTGHTNNVVDHATLLYDIGLAMQELERIMHNEAVWVEDAARRTANAWHDADLLRAAPKIGDTVKAASYPLLAAWRRTLNIPQHLVQLAP